MFVVAMLRRRTQRSNDLSLPNSLFRVLIGDLGLNRGLGVLIAGPGQGVVLPITEPTHCLGFRLSCKVISTVRTEIASWETNSSSGWHRLQSFLPLR